MRSRSSLHPDDPREILLVDDNHHGLVARRAVLQDMGYRVTTASGGEEAFELFQRAKFDLVITDHKMPRMTGTELIARIRETEPGARIILVSGFADALGLTENSTGADVVISKNAGEVPILRREVERLLSRRLSRRPPASQTRAARIRCSGA
ncbi:MAG TPA: response regulator [Bryobacteraceae bacterium]|nr:response regulator [Bryobacteraceae bacterium]